MKNWLPVILFVLIFFISTSIRRDMRRSMTRWLASKAGPTRTSGTRAGLLTLGAPLLVAACFFAVEVWAFLQSGSIQNLRFVAAAVVLLGYAPIATLGAPKMTRWQKNFEQHLGEEGAARSGAAGAASVARVTSGLGLLVSIGALALILPGAN